MNKLPFNCEYYKKYHPTLETRNGNKAELIRIDDGDSNFPVHAIIEQSEYTFMRDGRAFSRDVRSAFDLFMLIADAPIVWSRMGELAPEDRQLVVLKGSECIWQYHKAIKTLTNMVTDHSIPQSAADFYIPIPLYDLKRINYEKKKFKA